jgi:hypothetical protein
VPADLRDISATDELDGLLAAPGSASRLGQVLAAAGAPSEVERQPGEDDAVRAYRAAFAAPHPASQPASRLARVSGKAAAAALAGGLVLSGGAAAAAAGALPDVAQQTAHGVLAKVGVSVPAPSEHIGGHHRGRGNNTHTPESPAEHSATGRPSDRASHGSDVSGLARGTTSTGVDKGAAVSGTASGGKSRAGQNGKATRSPSGKKTPTPAVSERRNGSNQKPRTSSKAPTKLPQTSPHPSRSSGGRR